MIKVLVIEDEKRVADLLKIGLEENGYQVLVAYDGEMGWRLFQSNDFQLIISDIILPKLNGFELCQKIRKADEEIPILMLTALGTADDKLEGFDVGADDYMVKPSDFRELPSARVSIAEKKSYVAKVDVAKEICHADLHQSGTTGSETKRRTHQAFSLRNTTCRFIWWRMPKWVVSRGKSPKRYGIPISIREPALSMSISTI